MKKGNKQTHFIIHSFMVDELKLSGNELLIYALIYSYTVKSEGKCFFGSQEYIGKMLNASRQTVNTAIRNLSKKGLIEKMIISVDEKDTVYYVSKNLTEDVKNLDIGVSNFFTGGVKNLDKGVSKNLTKGCQKTLHNNNIYNNNDNYIYNNIYNKKDEDDDYIIVENYIPEDFYV